MGTQRLMITDAELLAEGVPLKKLSGVRRALERAVAARPELNEWPQLAAMARGMHRFLGCDWQVEMKRRK